MPAENWPAVRARLRDEIGVDNFDAFLAQTQLAKIEDGKACHTAPTRFLMRWVENHYRERMLRCWQQEDAEVREIVIVLRSAMLAPAREERPMATNGHVHHATAAAVEEAADDGGVPSGSAINEKLGGAPLDPRLKFETFAIGESNQLAHSAVLQLAESGRGNAVRFNPLYIHSDTGLGKTHLMQAAAWHANATAAQGRKILYLSGERFIFSFVQQIRSNERMAFGALLADVDVFMIDDLQFLRGATALLQFNRILTALIDAGRQVVLAADRPPRDLEGFEERVLSRLAGGIIVPIDKHDPTLRRVIIDRKLEILARGQPGFSIAPEVCTYLAGAIEGTGRDVEAVLNRLAVLSSQGAAMPTRDVAERVVGELARPGEFTRRVKIEDIQRIVAREYTISRADLLSSRRTANVVLPRQIAMYLAKKLTLRSLPEIGRRFGGRDHTTVIHAVRKIENLVLNDNQMESEIARLEGLLAA